MVNPGRDLVNAGNEAGDTALGSPHMPQFSTKPTALLTVS